MNTLINSNDYLGQVSDYYEQMDAFLKQNTLRLRDFQEEQQEKCGINRQPIGEITEPDVIDGVIMCRLCDQQADSDYIDQEVFICLRCADLIANIFASDCGRSTFGFASWDREDIRGKSEGRKALKQSVRTKVFERDEYRCVNCGSHKRLAIDHIHPVSRGGSDDMVNLQTLCQSCNNSKGTKTMEEWRAAQ